MNTDETATEPDQSRASRNSVRAGLSNDAWGVADRHRRWLEEFRVRNGRLPKVLAISNIANNGFRDSEVLRRYDLECHVLNADYYHVMSCPEWEEAAFDATLIKNDMIPVWSQIDLGDYERPRWFAQGRLETCLDYLIAINEGDARADQLWAKMAEDRDLGGATVGSSEFADPASPEDRRAAAQVLMEAFANRFPLRPDRFDEGDINAELDHFLKEARRYRRLFSYYDVVIGYAMYSFLPLMFGKRPFLSYEHGTIREIPFKEDFWGRICAVAFTESDAQLVTNADNVAAAERLGLDNYRFTPHTTNEGACDEAALHAVREDLRRRYTPDFVVFHPARHHWEARRSPSWEKANDVLIEGFARFVREVRPRALAVFVEWGQKVAESKALIESLGITDRVMWIPVQPVAGMRPYIALCDAVADQFHIGTWGGIVPLAAFHGKPSLIHVDRDVHAWALPEMPPVIESRTPDEVFAGLVRLTDASEAAAIGAASRRWYDAYHSSDVVAGRFLDAIISALEPPESIVHRRILRGLNDIVRSMPSRAEVQRCVDEIRALERTSLETQKAVEGLTARIAALELEAAKVDERLAKLGRAARIVMDPLRAAGGFVGRIGGFRGRRS